MHFTHHHTHLHKSQHSRDTYPVHMFSHNERVSKDQQLHVRFGPRLDHYRVHLIMSLRYSSYTVHQCCKSHIIPASLTIKQCWEGTIPFQANSSLIRSISRVLENFVQFQAITVFHPVHQMLLYIYIYTLVIKQNFKTSFFSSSL